jgi:MOSC domain-containing protein YiiM
VTHVDPSVLTINVAHAMPNPWKPTSTTGIDKRPTTEAVFVRAPGAKEDGLGSGLVGDTIGDRSAHGGDDQAVYAYAREDLDRWEGRLGRAITSGSFGENITTIGIDINEALIGERWRVGLEVQLQITDPRIPCATFRGWIGEVGWLRTFAQAAMPGAYFSVLEPGAIRAGDPIVVDHRPSHGVTVALVFRALTLEPRLLPEVLAAADDLPEETRLAAMRGDTFDVS